MTDTGDSTGNDGHPAHGQVGYLQLPAVDLVGAATFYRDVFGWSVDGEHGGFEAPAMIGQFTTGRVPSAADGPIIWICVDDLSDTVRRVQAAGGTVIGDPQLDGGERWLLEIEDVGGQRVGLVAPVTS